MASSYGLLEEKGYVYIEALKLPPSRPDESDLSFEDLHPGFSATRLAGRRLYRHQWEALRLLDGGFNVVLVSGTGSGKTEAWFSWVALRTARGEPVRVLAVYPTLALAWDQMARLEEYSRALGLGVVGVDSLAKRGERGLRSRVRDSRVVATNPAMLLYELKKHLVKPGSATLSPILESLDLLVVDELDFYDPRALALLLGMIELLAVLRGKGMQVAVLSATLANPEDLAGYLERVTGRPCRVVRGRPFRVESRVIVVLGKDLEAVRRHLAREAEARGLDLPREVEEALGDPRVFAEKAYLVADYLASLGVEPPSFSPDPVEILEWYARDEAEPRGLTLAFTRSINEAERLARSLRERLGEEAGRVAVHHHLVPKEVRRAVEEGARRGEVGVIVTPRTLTQGIDLGSVVRVVHVGLPLDVREFWQREGRKGRREGLEYSESIIVPRGRWDRQLLSRGVKTLIEWLSMPLERVYVNPENHYKALLTGAAKLLSPLLQASGGAELEGREREALKAAGVLKGGGVDTKALQRLWERLNFYEYGPPYGVKRVLLDPSSGGVRELEEVGRCDLVEKFQPGCFDPPHDAVVVDLVHPPKAPRVVYRIVEEPLKAVISRREPDWFMEAMEEYRSVKARWGEEARFLSDFARGMVESEVETIVYPPRRGFGLLRKIPHRTVWTVRSGRLRAHITPDGRVRVYRPSAYVPVESPVAGEYRDYTYGLMLEAPQGYPPELLRLGLATLGVYLRRSYGVPLGLIKYSVYAVGERRLVEVHEESAAGLLEKLDWARVARSLSEWRPGDIDEILLLALDEHAYATLEGLGFEWERALDAAGVVARLLASLQTLEVRVKDLALRVPKPSRALRMGSVAAIAHKVEVRGLSMPFHAVAVAYFDGERVHVASDLVLGVGGRPREPLALVEHAVLMDVGYEDFRIYAFNPESEARDLERAGLKLLAGIVRGAGSIRDMASKAGLEVSDPSLLARAIKVEGLDVEEPRLEEVVEALSKPLAKAELDGWRRRVLEAYVSSYAKLVYLAALAFQGAKKGGGSGEASSPS